MVLKLRDWIPIEKLSWKYLSANPNAIELLEANPDKIDWQELSRNPNAIHLLEANPEKIDWRYLSINKNAIHLLEANSDKIHWDMLSRNPNAVHLLEANRHKINWMELSKNPKAIHLLEANPEMIDWKCLSLNSSAMHLLRTYQKQMSWGYLSRNPSAISMLVLNHPKIDWMWLSANENAMYLLETNRDKIDWEWLSINPSIFIETHIEEPIEESMDKLIEDPIEDPKIEEPSSKDIQPTTMKNLGFECNQLSIDYYHIKDSNSKYITEKTTKRIIEHINVIIAHINSKTACIGGTLLQKYMDAQLCILNKYLNILKSCEFDTNVLTENLDIMKTAVMTQILDIPLSAFNIQLNEKLDYLTHKEELMEMLKNKKEDDHPEEIPEAEDESILRERMELVLSFEHPNGYVDDDGSYNYEEIECKLWDELKQAAMMYRLRYKARKHFEDMNKQEYDYAGMKKNKQQLHGELKAAMRLLKKYMDVPMAVEHKE